jgi:hypothetical protein
MTSTAPTTLTARTPEDLLAVVPVVLGFVPGDSVVMLTFGSRRPFHARVDLPPDRSGIPEVVELLREPAFRHRVPQVVFVVYSAEQAPAKRVSRALVKAFRESGIEVIDVLRADGQRWFPMLHGRSCVPPWGVPYDVSAHPFAAQAVLDGRVTHGSRADLAASLEPEPDRVDAVAAAVARLSLPGGEPGGADAWALLQVLAHVVDGTRPGDEDAARLLVGLQDLAVRDAVWVLMDRDRSREHVAFWTDLVRRAPRALMPAPAALLAFAAWLSGHGALAWCAIDRCVGADPDHVLAAHVAQLLLGAVPPEVWQDVWQDIWEEGADERDEWDEWDDEWEEAGYDDGA